MVKKLGSIDYKLLKEKRAILDLYEFHIFLKME